VCFNTVIVNPRKKRLQFLDGVLRAEMLSNRDGYGLWSYDPDVYARSVKMEDFWRWWEEARSARLIHVHFRAASSGSVDLDNVHMWRVGDYYVSHNGYVLEFMDSYADWGLLWSRPRGKRGRYLWWDEDVVEGAVPKEGGGHEDSDTLKLVRTYGFREAVEKRDLGELAKMLRCTGFFGVMFLTKPTEVIAISKGKPLYVYDFSGILVLVNGELHHSIYSYRKYGIEFRTPVPHRAYVNSILEFDVERMQLRRVRPIESWPRDWEPDPEVLKGL